jgi:gamma-tubulin complex component 2
MSGNSSNNSKASSLLKARLNASSRRGRTTTGTTKTNSKSADELSNNNTNDNAPPESKRIEVVEDGDACSSTTTSKVLAPPTTSASTATSTDTINRQNVIPTPPHDEEEQSNDTTPNHSNATPKHSNTFVPKPPPPPPPQQQLRDKTSVLSSTITNKDTRRAWADDTPLQKIKDLLSTVPLQSKVSSGSTPSYTSIIQPHPKQIHSSTYSNTSSTSTSVSSSTVQKPHVTFISDNETDSKQQDNNNNTKSSIKSTFSLHNVTKYDTDATKTKIKTTTHPLSSSSSSSSSTTSSSSSSSSSPTQSSTPHKMMRHNRKKLPKRNEVSTDNIDNYHDWTRTEVDSTCIPYNSYVQIQAGSTHMANTIACNIVMRPPSTNDEFIHTSTRSIGDNLDRPGSASTTATATATATATTNVNSHKHKRNIIKYEAQAHEPNNMTSTHGIHPSSLLIVYVKTITSSSSSSSSSSFGKAQDSSSEYYHPKNSVQQNTLPPPQVLKYGDIIALHSPLARNRALGVRQVSMQDNIYATSVSNSTIETKIQSQHQHHEVGFYRSILGDKEKWLVVSTQDCIRIGSNVRDVESILYNQYTLHSMGLPVRSNGHPVILLNIATGGVLSLPNHDSNTSKYSLLNIQIRGQGMHNIFTSNEEEEEKDHISTWIIQQVGAPSCPLWNSQRVFLMERHLLQPERHMITKGSDPYPNRYYPLKDFPIHVQEQVMMKELLGAMMGLEGRYIKFNSTTSSQSGKGNMFFECKFTVSSSATDGIDPSLMNLVQHILPLCTDFVFVNEFIGTRMAKFEYGLIARALVSEISTLIQEYLSYLCQLERHVYQSKLSVAKLWYLLQPSLSSVRTLRQLVTSARYYKGGQLLTQINNMTSSELNGDSRAEDIAQRVVQVASRPFMDMLSSWISKGEVYDPFNEFMIENKFPFQFKRASTSSANVTKTMTLSSLSSSVWEDCFCLRPQHIYLINDHTAEKVLTIGKYLNVLRECSKGGSKGSEGGQNTALPHIDTLRGCITMTEKINDAFNFSASTVLNLMLTDYNFLDNLRFVKKYFLIEQGDFFVQFLDMAEKELLAPVTKISKSRIHTLLLMSIQHGNQSYEANRNMLLDELICEFSRDNLIDRLDAIHKTSGGIISGPQLRTPSHSFKSSSHKTELKGIDTFSLDCRISWPLSLIFAQSSMQLYKLLFRHLFFCKYVERRLFATWLDHQMLKEFTLRALLGKTYMLRQKMVHFMQNLVYYMMFEVIEPHWHKLMENIANVKTVDNLAQIHNHFQASISQECLLTNIALLRILAKLMTTCLGFADHVRLFMKKTGMVSFCFFVFWERIYIVWPLFIIYFFILILIGGFIFYYSY